MIGQFFDTIFVASSDTECVITFEYKIIIVECNY